MFCIWYRLNLGMSGQTMRRRRMMMMMMLLLLLLLVVSNHWKQLRVTQVFLSLRFPRGRHCHMSFFSCRDHATSWIPPQKKNALALDHNYPSGKERVKDVEGKVFSWELVGTARMTSGIFQGPGSPCSARELIFLEGSESVNNAINNHIMRYIPLYS